MWAIFIIISYIQEDLGAFLLYPILVYYSIEYMYINKIIKGVLLLVLLVLVVFILAYGIITYEYIYIYIIKYVYVYNIIIILFLPGVWVWARLVYRLAFFFFVIMKFKKIHKFNLLVECDIIFFFSPRLCTSQNSATQPPRGPSL